MKMVRNLGAAASALALSGCAAANFNIAPWQSPNLFGVEAVDLRLNQIHDGMNTAFSKNEDGKAVMTATIILAAVAGAGALALGASKDYGIVAAGAATTASAGQSAIQPRVRSAALTKAMTALDCIKDEFDTEVTLADGNHLIGGSKGARTLYGGTNTVDIAPVDATIADAGRTALNAAQELTDGLRGKLAGAGTDPDYNKLLETMSAKKEDAKSVGDKAVSTQRTFVAALAAAGTNKAVPDDQLKKLADYPVRIEACKNKAL